MVLEGIKTFNVEIKSIHADTTSKNVYWQYTSQLTGDNCVKIDYGHSKDKRPDLNKLCLELRALMTELLLLEKSWMVILVIKHEIQTSSRREGLS